MFNKPTALLYCSVKDVYSVDMEEREGYLEPLIQAMQTIEHCIKIAETKEDVVKMFPLTTDNFRWKGSVGSQEFAKMIWQEAFK